MDELKPHDNLKRMAIICWALVALWMVAIFTFSANPADESESQSGWFTHIVASVIVPGYAEMTPEEQDAAAQPFDHPVRKTAHATEYAFLGVLVSVALAKSAAARAEAAGAAHAEAETAREKAAGAAGATTSRRRSFALRIVCATAICALYASTDEFHQLFVPGRAGMLSDVGIDTLGAFVGILLAFLVMTRRRKRKAQ